MSDDNGGIKKEENTSKSEEQIKQEAINTQKKKEAENNATKDYKIAEIWIKDGSIMLDASPQFWNDKLRALGLLDMCKDIVKEFKQQKPQIITGKESKQFMSKLNRVKNRVGGMFGKK